MPTNIVYDLLGIVQDVEIVSNPSFGEISDDGGRPAELFGSIVSDGDKNKDDVRLDFPDKK